MAPRQHDTHVEQRAGVLGIELQHPLERLERGIEPLVIEEGAPQEQERLEIVGILLQQVGEPDHRRPRPPTFPQQLSQRQIGLVEGGEGVERVLIGALRLLPFFLLFVEPPQIEPDLDVAAIELERGPVRAQRARRDPRP